MALYEKMVLISEQEYLHLKGFQMHVGERHDGDIDYGAGDDGGGGGGSADDGGGVGDGGGEGGGGEGGGDGPSAQHQRLNELYGDVCQRLRQHLLRYRI